MIDTQIITGGKKIISTGLFLAKRTGTIILTDSPDTVTIEYQFEQKDSEGPSVIGETISSSHLKIIFVNFDNANLGLGTKDFVNLGTFRDKPIYFAYRIYTLDDKELRTFEYTFYTDI